MKLFKKKSLSYILVASMAMAALTGCSKEDKKTEDAVVEDNTTATEDKNEETKEETKEEVKEEVKEEATEEVTEEETTEEEATEEVTEEEATEEATEGAATYTGTAAGFAGDVTATVTMNEDGTIANITVDVASETPALGGVAGPDVAAAIVENQSLAVDTVSGATVTSTAVINAVRIALTEAGSELAQ
ncbi:MAG: FMN-binding protein [Clostridiales bacterium]|nr:FMN-binding protein [Clostridiales bacterium]